MENEKQAYLNNIFDSLKTITGLAHELNSMANSVGYLHPHMASDLENISALLIENANNIRYSRGAEIQSELKSSEQFMGKMLKTMLDTLPESSNGR